MNNPSRSLALAAWGDPFDGATWSGTPKNVANALRALGIEVISLNCRPSRSTVLAAHAADRLRGLDIGFTRHRLASARCAKLTATLPKHCAGILHMSSVSAMPKKLTAASDVKQFLLCDSLEDFWQRYDAENASRYSPRQSRVAREREQGVVDALDLAFPIGEHAAHSLRENYGFPADRIHVVGTGRGGIKALEGEKSYNSKRVLMVAKQRFEDKGGPLLIQAIQIARRTDPNIELTLVSPDNFRSYAEGAEGITVTGTLPWEELQRLFDEAPLYAMPALCEPWGLVFAEALATKTPILGLDRAAFPELSGNGRFGFVAPEAIPEAVAHTLLDALSDPARLQKMGTDGQNYCLAHFTWERTARLIADAIWP